MSGAQATIPGVEEQRELTFGQRACGVSFNPGGNPLVADIKQKFADIVDQLHELRTQAFDRKELEVARMYSVAITDVQTAQMWAVKAVTWR